jgi:hypothetical protein
MMPEYDQLLARARVLYGDCAIEFDAEPNIKPERAGALVQAWVWVPYEDEELESGVSLG